METYRLAASRRTAAGKRARSLHAEGHIPAVLYGHGVASLNLAVEANEFQKIFRQASSSSLVDLTIGDQAPVKVLIQAVQRHPTRNNVTHVDFYQVRMTEKLEAEIELKLVGESSAVKEQGGILIRTLDKVRVECLPSDLVPSIDVDVSKLKTFDDHIKISDLVVPPGITILDGADEIIAGVTPPRSEAEIEALSGAVTEDVSAVGTVETKKPEEAEGEGAEATPDATAEKK